MDYSHISSQIFNEDYNCTAICPVLYNAHQLYRQPNDPFTLPTYCQLCLDYNEQRNIYNFIQRTHHHLLPRDAHLTFTTVVLLIVVNNTGCCIKGDDGSN